MQDVNKQLLDAVKHCHGIFDQYVSHHLEKPDYDKAAANERHRAICAEAIAAAEQAHQAKPVAWKLGKRPPSVFKTSEAGRQYVADFFANALQRHDFSSYIKGHLAADFACALSDGLHAMQRAAPVMRDVLIEDLPAAVIEATSEAIGEAYDCVRVWEAWGVGTMGPDDFRQVADDVCRVEEIARAAIIAWHGSAAQPPAVAVPRFRDLTDSELWEIRNHVAINEVTRDDDSKTMCVKHGRAIIRAMLAAQATNEEQQK